MLLELWWALEIRRFKADVRSVVMPVVEIESTKIVKKRYSL